MEKFHRIQKRSNIFLTVSLDLKQSPTPRPHVTTSVRPRRQQAAMCKICTSLKQPYTWEIYSVIISMCIGCALEIYIWLSNKVFCNIHIGDTLNYLNSRCNTAKLLWVVIYVVCYGCFSPDLVVMNICRQRLIKVDHQLRQRSLANENAVVCRQGAMRWRVDLKVPLETI